MGRESGRIIGDGGVPQDADSLSMAVHPAQKALLRRLPPASQGNREWKCEFLSWVLRLEVLCLIP